MTEIFFYHLGVQSLEEALPALLEKTLERGWKALLQAKSIEQVKTLNNLLWTYCDDSFLPHGDINDGFPNKQPVFLTSLEENPNQADVLFLVGGAERHETSEFTRCVLMFDGKDKEMLQQARQVWKNKKEEGCKTFYYQQDNAGIWQKKTKI